MSAKNRIIVVTGGNKGIGFEIIKKLVKIEGQKVILTARNDKRGAEACKTLKKEGHEVDFQRMDINDQKSIDEFCWWVRKKYGGFDVLINNAAIAVKKTDNLPFHKQAEPTMRTNFYGTLHVCETLIPIMRKGGNVVNVASGAGTFVLKKMSKKLQARFNDPKLTPKGLSTLVDKFIEDVEKKQHLQAGWGDSCYGTSKLAVITLTRILSEQLRERDISATSFCPGWCRTDMSSHTGNRSAEQGAKTAVWLAMQRGEGRPSGGFFQYS